MTTDPARIRANARTSRREDFAAMLKALAA